VQAGLIAFEGEHVIGPLSMMRAAISLAEIAAPSHLQKASCFWRNPCAASASGWCFDDVILDAPIALPAFGSVVAGDWIGNAVALGDQHVGNGTEFDERVPHRVGASLGPRDIEGFVAGVVGVAGDLDDVLPGVA
jgi:hypothetical protein